MQVRVLVLSPFNYLYGSKVAYLNTGESFYLESHSKEDVEELKALLSPACPFKQWVHLDPEDPVVKQVQAELDEYQKGTPLPDPTDIEIGNQVKKVTTPDLTAPPQEPIDPLQPLEPLLKEIEEIEEVTKPAVEVELEPALEPEVEAPKPVRKKRTAS